MRWINNDLIAWAKSENFSFSILSKSKEFLGRINIRSVHSQGIWNMGFWILPAHWGKGYAAEAAKTVFEFAFEQLQIKKMCVAHAQANIQSKRVLEKIGMRLVETKRRAF